MFPLRNMRKDGGIVMSDSFTQVDGINMIKDALYKWAKSKHSDEPGYVGGATIEAINSIVITANPNASPMVVADGVAKIDPNYSLVSIGNDVLSYSGTPPQQQKIKTHKFSLELTETTSTTTTKTFKIGGSVSEKITVDVKIPFIGGGKSETTITVNAEYSTSTSSTKTTSKKVTYEMPSQEIILNPGEKYVVNAYLYTGTINGKTLLKIPVTGKVDYVFRLSYNMESLDTYKLHRVLTIGEFASELGEFCDGGLVVDPNNKDLAYIIGRGNISVPYAIKTELEIKKIDSQGKEDIERIEFPLIDAKLK